MLSPVKVPEMLNSVQFARMYNEAYGGKFFSDEAIERYRNGSDPDLYPNDGLASASFIKTIPGTRRSI